MSQVFLLLALTSQLAAVAAQPSTGPGIEKMNLPGRDARPHAPRLQARVPPELLAGEPLPAIASQAPLAYSTYFGGSGSDIVTAIAADDVGNLYLTGYSNSTDLPPADTTLSHAVSGSCGGEQNAYACFDAFVAKLDPTGQRLLFKTYLGGSGDDLATSIALDPAGSIYIAGYTNSLDLPTLNAVQPRHAADVCGLSGGPCFDAFVAKINADGPSWSYVSYLGGSGDDLAQAITVDATGSAVIVGTTTSLNFPSLHALQSSWGGGEAESFIAKVGSGGSQLEFATYLGGSGDDFATSLSLGPGGDLYFAGSTNSPDLPTTGALQPAGAGGMCGALESKVPCFDGFLARLAPDGKALRFLTYLGGTGGDYVNGLAVDSSGAATVVGMTTSVDFPVSFGAFQTSGGGNQTDAFVAEVDPWGSSLIYSTYLGGTGADSAQGVAVGTAGRAFVVGTTYGAGFPITNPLSSTVGFYDVFLAVLSADGSALDFSTRLGGAGNDKSHGVALDPFGNVYLAAESFSTDFQTVRALQASYGGGGFDGAFAKFALGDSPVLHASPASCDFGEQIVGTRSEPRHIDLTNIGAGVLHVENLETLGDFEVSGSCSSLAPGESCGVDLIFAPVSSGLQSGSLTIVHDGLGGVEQLELVGEGIAPEISLSAASVHFDPQLVGTQSDPQEIMLTNSGTASLELSAINISGRFIQENDCPLVLAVDGRCAIRVAFTPAEPGDQAGKLTVTNSSPDETRIISLSGSGTDFGLITPQDEIVARAGESTTFAISIVPEGGFQESVTLACAGVPKAANCSFSEAQITPDGSNAAEVKVTVSTTARSNAPPASARRPSARPLFAALLFLLLSALGFFAQITCTARRRSALRMLPYVAALLLFVVTCGGGGPSAIPSVDVGTPAGTYTLTLTGTAGGVTKSVAKTLVVR